MAAASVATRVVVGCKHPSGIQMRVFGPGERKVPALGGGEMRIEPRARAIGSPVQIFGPVAPYGQVPKVVGVGGQVVSGYALTPNVPADVARKWFEQNAQSDLVENNIVFMCDTMEAATKRAKEQRTVRSGLEPLNTDTTTKGGKTVPADPRWPPSISKNLTRVDTDTRDED